MNSLKTEEISIENGKKLDRIMLFLEGAGEDAPGLLHNVAKHGHALYGDNGHDGLISRVAIMWRIHVWVLCSVSAGFGFMLKSIIEGIVKKP